MSSEQALLYQAYLDQKMQYGAATRLTELIRLEFEQGRHPHDELQQLNEIMTRIGETDKRTAGVRAAAEVQARNSELQQVVDEVRTIVEHLLGQINMIEQLARASRQKLAPHISTQVRERRMQSAYGQT